MSIVQMPAGVPVATTAINGSKNAALIAVSILALQDAELAARLEAFRAKQTADPSCVFTSPEVASVGMTEQQAQERGIAYKVWRFPFTASGKATAAGDRDGFVKLLFGEDDTLLGAHMVGQNVTEMIAEPTLARMLGATAHRIARTIHAHPTMNEGVMEAAEAALGEAIHL